MFYQFTNMTGRLSQATNIQTPLFPVRAMVPSRGDTSRVMYDSSTKFAAVTQARGQSTRTIPGTNVKYAPLDPKLKAKQQLFQAHNDIPVHLKGGPFDKILYRSTLGLCLAGTAYCYYFIYTRASLK